MPVRFTFLALWTLLQHDVWHLSTSAQCVCHCAGHRPLCVHAQPHLLLLPFQVGEEKPEHAAPNIFAFTIRLSFAGWSNKERGSSSAIMRYVGADVALGEHVTPASESGYKYYYSISHCYSQLWDLTPAFTDDLSSMRRHLRSHSKPLARWLRAWCKAPDIVFRLCEGWANTATRVKFTHEAPLTQWTIREPPAPYSEGENGLNTYSRC